MTTTLFIFPKVIWNHIIDLISTSDIRSLFMASYKFKHILNESNWKRFFLEERKYDIAVVRCNSKRIDGFWKHAYSSYVSIDTIEGMFTHIGADSTADTYFFYKVFLKIKQYNIDTNISKTFNQNVHSVEIIGDNSELSGCQINLVTDSYLSIKRIKMYCSISCSANKVYIDNCYVSPGKHIEINSTECLTVSNSTFWYSQLYIKCNSNILICTITDNHFDDYKLRFVGDCTESSIINIISNIFVDDMFGDEISIDSKLLYNEFDHGTFVSIAPAAGTRSDRVFENNSIAHIYACLDICRPDVNYVFRNNYFKEVQTLANSNTDHIKLNKCNTFQDCGIEITNLIDQS